MREDERIANLNLLTGGEKCQVALGYELWDTRKMLQGTLRRLAAFAGAIKALRNLQDSAVAARKRNAVEEKLLGNGHPLD
jgi:hypothetical protein